MLSNFARKVVARRLLTRRSSELISRMAAASQANKIALTDSHTKEQFTYQQLLNASENMAVELSERIPKDCAAIGGFNKSSSSMVISMLAAWRLKKMFVPLPSAHTATELNYFTSDSKLGAIVCSSRSEVNPDFLASLTVPLIETNSVNNLRNTPSKRYSIDSNYTATEDWDSLVIYTSGTTGKPKGVVHSSQGINSMIESLVTAWKLNADDAILHFLPLYHIHGLVNKLLCTLWVGGQVDFLESGKAEVIWKRLADEQLSRKQSLTLFMAVPTVYAKMLECSTTIPKEQLQAALQTIKNLRLMVCGSAPLAESINHKWKDLTGHSLLERYGMTEIGMALTNPYEGGERRVGTVGKPFPLVECKLVDENGFFISEHDKPGELWVKGPSVFKRYLNLPEVTKNSFGERGWFKTGDIAEFSVDGYYKILGRNCSDIIKSAGYVVSALEIELELLEHPQVAEAVVFGLKDDILGEKIVAVLRLFKDCEHNAKPEEDLLDVEKETQSMHLCDKETLKSHLQSFLSHRLARYKQPREFIVVDTIPLNHLGKVNKKTIARELKIA
jgi:malonyl-CoA/methylmalonyl-CoA synthetase